MSIAKIISEYALETERAAHLTDAALQESYDEGVRHARIRANAPADPAKRTIKDIPLMEHYFNAAKQAELHQHRSAFSAYLKSLGTPVTLDAADAQNKSAREAEELAFTKTTAKQVAAIQGVVKSWDHTLPNQLVTIISQLSDIVNQKWYGSQHEAYLLGVVEEIAYCAYVQQTKNEKSIALNLLGSTLSPYNRIGFGTKILDFVAHKGYEDARKDNGTRKLAYLSALNLKAA